jgi:Squalene-hopene cyclase C-terminal domain/Prenyltransferase and squalene oxidase repeat
MQLPRLLLAALLCFALGPAVAQDGGDDDSGIEVSEDPKPGEEKPAPPDDGYDEEATKKKNAGLAGGGEQDDGDPNAPKVKADLQTRINEAIQRGVEALKAMQDKDGSWGPVRATRSYDGTREGNFVRDELGPTAWAVYTLAKCGVKKTDPAIDNGLKYIANNTKFVFDVIGGKPKEATPPPGKGKKPGAGKDKDKDEPENRQRNISQSNPRTLTSYESAAIVLMIEAVYESSAKLTGKHRKRRLVTESPTSLPDGSRIPKDTWKMMHERILYLTVGRRASPGKGGTSIIGQQNLKENGIDPKSKNAGGWRYGQANPNDADLSATQFVLLALRAASQAGYPIEKVSPATWELAAQYAKNCQKPDGGFGYQVGGPSYASMTACGIGCLLICKEQMELSAEKKPPQWIDGAIQSGMDWLDKNFDAEKNAGHTERPELFYYLYGVERVGDLSGRKEFNGKDWYLRGATLLLERQQGDGGWSDATGFPPHNVLGTCFALLFLKRATIPVVTFHEPEAKPGE